jgi:glucokinase
MTGAALGLDIGGSAVKWVLLAGDDTILQSGSSATPATGTGSVVALLAQLADGPGEHAVAIGVGVPAHVSRRHGTVRLLPNIPGNWSGFPLGPALAERINRPVRVLNDARAFGHGELRTGAARGRPDAVFVTIGTGVGGAVAIGGEILSSDDDAAGELGHVRVDSAGTPCGCGGEGCLETVASAPALVSAAARGVLLGHSPALAEMTGGSLDRLTPTMVAAAAGAGDDFCQRLIARAGRALGLALGNVCALLTIPTVVVGGGATDAIDLLLPHVRRELESRASLVPGIDVRRAALGPTAGAIGAALWARETSTPTSSREGDRVALDQ